MTTLFSLTMSALLFLKPFLNFFSLKLQKKNLATQQIIYCLITAPPYLGSCIVSSPLLMRGKVVHKAKPPAFPLNVLNAHKANSLLFF